MKLYKIQFKYTHKFSSYMLMFFLILLQEVVGDSSFIDLTELPYDYAYSPSSEVSYANSSNTMSLIGGSETEKGIFAGANSSIVYKDLKQYGFTTFETSLGLNNTPEVKVGTQVVFKIYLDGNISYTSPTYSYDTNAETVSLDITGVDVLALVIDEQETTGYDYSCWADPKLYYDELKVRFDSDDTIEVTSFSYVTNEFLRERVAVYDAWKNSLSSSDITVSTDCSSDTDSSCSVTYEYTNSSSSVVSSLTVPVEIKSFDSVASIPNSVPLARRSLRKSQRDLIDNYLYPAFIAYDPSTGSYEKGTDVYYIVTDDASGLLVTPTEFEEALSVLLEYDPRFFFVDSSSTTYQMDNTNSFVSYVYAAVPSSVYDVTDEYQSFLDAVQTKVESYLSGYDESIHPVQVLYLLSRQSLEDFNDFTSGSSTISDSIYGVYNNDASAKAPSQLMALFCAYAGVTSLSVSGTIDGSQSAFNIIFYDSLYYYAAYEKNLYFIGSGVSRFSVSSHSTSGISISSTDLDYKTYKYPLVHLKTRNMFIEMGSDVSLDDMVVYYLDDLGTSASPSAQTDGEYDTSTYGNYSISFTLDNDEGSVVSSSQLIILDKAPIYLVNMTVTSASGNYSIGYSGDMSTGIDAGSEDVIFVQGETSIQYDISGLDYNFFQSFFGANLSASAEHLPSQLGGQTSLVFKVLVDDVEVFSSGRMNTTTFHDHVTYRFGEGVQTLTLVTEPGTSGSEVCGFWSFALVTDSDALTDTVPPTISGVEDNGVYTDPVTPLCSDTYLASTILTLNGSTVESYSNGDTITDFGEYTLVASDVNGNTNEISFSIVSSSVALSQKTLILVASGAAAALVVIIIIIVVIVIIVKKKRKAMSPVGDISAIEDGSKRSTGSKRYSSAGSRTHSSAGSDRSHSRSSQRNSVSEDRSHSRSSQRDSVDEERPHSRSSRRRSENEERSRYKASQHPSTAVAQNNLPLAVPLVPAVPQPSVADARRSPSGRGHRSSAGHKRRSSAGHKRRSSAGHKRRSSAGHKRRSSAGHKRRSSAGHKRRSSAGHKRRSSVGHKHRSPTGQGQSPSAAGAPQTSTGQENPSPSGRRRRSSARHKRRSSAGRRRRSSSGRKQQSPTEQK